MRQVLLRFGGVADFISLYVFPQQLLTVRCCSQAEMACKGWHWPKPLRQLPWHLGGTQ